MYTSSAGEKEWRHISGKRFLMALGSVTFAFVALILYRVAWGPLQKALADREAAIDGAILGAEKTRQEAEAVKQRSNNPLTRQ